MNRTITATHSHAGSKHPAFAWPQSVVVDVNSFNDEFGIRRQGATARFRGAGLEGNTAPEGYTPVFTPPRRRLRMRTETIVALFGGIVAALLITWSSWLISTHRKDAANGAATSGTHREQRLFDEALESKTSR